MIIMELDTRVQARNQGHLHIKPALLVLSLWPLGSPPSIGFWHRVIFNHKAAVSGRPTLSAQPSNRHPASTAWQVCLCHPLNWPQLYHSRFPRCFLLHPAVSFEGSCNICDGIWRKYGSCQSWKANVANLDKLALSLMSCFWQCLCLDLKSLWLLSI